MNDCHEFVFHFTPTGHTPLRYSAFPQQWMVPAKAKNPEARIYQDYREMLAKEKPDLVAVAPRWTVNHKEYLLACAEAGAHGIVEKPLTPDEEQRVRLVAESLRLPRFSECEFWATTSIPI